MCREVVRITSCHICLPPGKSASSSTLLIGPGWSELVTYKGTNCQSSWLPPNGTKPDHIGLTATADARGSPCPTIVSAHPFLSVQGVWVYCYPTEKQKSYAIPRGFMCQTALILPRAMKQLPVPRDRKRWLRTRQWLLHVADTREGWQTCRQARDRKR